MKPMTKFQVLRANAQVGSAKAEGTRMEFCVMKAAIINARLLTGNAIGKHKRKQFGIVNNGKIVIISMSQHDIHRAQILQIKKGFMHAQKEQFLEIITPTMRYGKKIQVGQAKAIATRMEFWLGKMLIKMLINAIRITGNAIGQQKMSHLRIV